MRIGRLLLAICMLILPKILFGQNYYFQNLTVKTGLPQSRVSSIVQDSLGYVWIATESGVSRYDGLNYFNYSSKNGMCSGGVTAMLLDTEGRMWFGHQQGGLSIFENGKMFKVQLKNIELSDQIFAINQDDGGAIWVATLKKGAFRFYLNALKDNEILEFEQFDSKKGLDNDVFDLFKDSKGKMWFVTYVGLKFSDDNYKSFNKISLGEASNYPVTSVQKDNKGNLLIGTWGYGLVVVTENGEIVKYVNADNYLPSDKISKLFKDRSGNIWASLWDNGVVKFDADAFLKEKISLFEMNADNGLGSNKIVSFFEDSENNLWLGTSDAGVSIFKGKRFLQFTEEDGLLNKQVWATFKDSNGLLWVGTNGGISVFDENLVLIRSFTINHGLPHNQVMCFDEDIDGNVWFGTWGGLGVWEKSSGKFYKFGRNDGLADDHINTMKIAPDGIIWIGTINGLSAFDTKQNRYKNYTDKNGLGGTNVSHVYIDSKGRIWVATRCGKLSVLVNGEITLYSEKDGLEHSCPTTIGEDAFGDIWIGTEGGGVFRYDGNRFKSYTTENGLVSNFITALWGDQNGNLWIGTNNGVTRIEVQSNKFLTYTESDGFSGIEVKSNAIFENQDGNILFGTINGFMVYETRFDRINLYAPKTHLNGIQLFLKDTLLSQNATLTYNLNHVTFDFIGISFSNYSKVNYQYTLEGFDNDWSEETTTHKVTYSNLPPGKYVFKVKACNNFGIWNEKPTEFHFTIAPPFWQTWWFYLLVISFAIVSVYVFIKMRTKKLLEDKLLLEQLVTERTYELEQEKNIVQHQSKEIEQKNRDITDSIIYAKNIQEAILPNPEMIAQTTGDGFVLFKPRDIVSGDFYWYKEKHDKVIIAAADCTGHGVPGALMSMVGNTMLNQIVTSEAELSANNILDELNNGVANALKQKTDGDQLSAKDGMDIALMIIDKAKRSIEFSGANRPLIYIKSHELGELKPDKMSINNLTYPDAKFSSQTIQLEKGDSVFVFSDGYPDQFGGDKGKKFMIKNLKTLFIENADLPMVKMQQLLNDEFEKWREGHEQVDDVLIIGLRF